ncbi:thiosulfate oxidation carrier complex protein SoxZ [Rhodopseudomonas sp. HC1]|uniref:thiosulfate oxidation carrier complex protein SoxZ n=1 Tax=Rhodopseudomonas infernalis TaxID=2897386 RepID=UPI001EE8A311|nr:thiosulfate oxidation carrier complex protein SoxZ [Rhodopseudomonas infernalis]MCG6203449.1 thiosulfate oxidation carrier complex protein SoxZ [Rhodopseudomonas infernalis]
MTAPLSSRPRVRIPPAAKAGEIIEIRTLLEHPMETGLRRTPDGQPIPRDILARFEAQANGETFLHIDFRNATSANPDLVFHARVAAATDFKFVWTHEDGRSISTSVHVAVT